jgi:hypothetical protein
MSAKARKNTSVLRGPVSTARDRLLDAVERLFAEYAFGAVPCYFGAKENLFKPVLMRRAILLRDKRSKT